MKVSRNELIHLARAGAQARLTQLQLEVNSILKMFPDLKRARRGGAIAPDTASDATPSGRRRAGWTPAKRKAAADRMRRYWAGRRAAAGKKR